VLIPFETGAFNSVRTNCTYVHQPRYQCNLWMMPEPDPPTEIKSEQRSKSDRAGRSRKARTPKKTRPHKKERVGPTSTAGYPVTMCRKHFGFHAEFLSRTLVELARTETLLVLRVLAITGLSRANSLPSSGTAGCRALNPVALTRPSLRRRCCGHRTRQIL
jgi:hypothetical protein